jgi:hypothetical protein
MDFKAIELFKKFSQQEKNEFKKFLLSPFFTGSKKAILIYNYLVKYYPDFNSPKFNKSRLCTAVFSKSTCNDSTLRNLMADFYNLQTKFLTYYNIEKELNFELTTRLIEKLIEKEMNKDAMGLINESSKKLYGKKKIESDDFHKLYISQISKYNTEILSRKLSSKKNIENIFTHIKKCREYIEIYFVIESLKIWNISFNLERKTSKQIESDSAFLEDILSRINSNFSGLPENFMKYLQINYKVYLTFKNTDRKNSFTELKELFYNSLDIFGDYEKSFVMGLLLDYCVTSNKDSVKDKKFFEEELFKLYKVIVAKKLYKSPVNSFMPVDLVRNIILNAIKRNEFDWLRSFMQLHKNEIQEKYRKDLLFYSYAIIDFNEEKYEDALESLNKIKFNYFPIKIDAKLLTLKTFFKIKSYDTIASYSITYKQFLQDNKSSIPELKALKHKNFIKAVNMLSDCKIFKDKKMIEEIRTFLSINKTADEEWFTKEIKLIK